MKKLREIAIAAVMIPVFAGVLWAGEFEAYPGAQLDENLTKEAIEMSATSPGAALWNVQVYTTMDPFEKVVAFYEKIGTEYTMPVSQRPVKLPSGKELKRKYFLFGEAKDPRNAEAWIRVQNPLVLDRAVPTCTPGISMKDAPGQEVSSVTTIMLMTSNE